MKIFATVQILALVLAVGVRGQTPSSRPAFEVAEIKPSDPASAMKEGKPRLLPGGRAEIPGMTVKMLIMMAYGVQQHTIVGVPKWAENSRFDIVAKATPNIDFAVFRLMLQGLLEDRFKLKFHHEDKSMSVFALTLGKRALKLQEASGGRQDCSWRSVQPGGDAGARDGVTRRRECVNMSMTELAQQLPGWGGIGIDVPVVDQTGLTGKYDFQLVVGLGDLMKMKGVMSKDGAGGGEGSTTGVADMGPTIFAALEQVGLKLESRKMPFPVMVLDQVEPPSAN
jgi:uncharacterized protein (TIGR03435 family)